MESEEAEAGVEGERDCLKVLMLQCCIDGLMPPQDRRYWCFLCSSFFTFLSGVLMILFSRLVLCVVGADQGAVAQHGFLNEAKEWAGELLSGQTKVGKALNGTIFVISIASQLTYFYDAQSGLVEKCMVEYPLTLKFDFFLNILFMAYFFLRFIAANDKLMFMFELFSFVDFFTIPPSFVSLILGRVWIGLRCLRILRLNSFPEILQYLNILETARAIRLLQLVAMFMSIWWTAAGFIHLIENYGDPPDFSNGQTLSYFECVYCMIVTMSTVGYGDIYPSTLIGRAFQIIFLVVGLAMFTTVIPEAMILVGTRKKFGGTYKNERGKTFVVVSGHITFETVTSFLSDFHHVDREDVDVEAVFLHPDEPALEFEGFLKKQYPRVRYFQGSLMNCIDMEAVQVDSADAVVILTNKYCQSPDDEDASNIMRVIAVKDYCDETRVIIQLMLYHNKSYLLNIPSWDESRDAVVCLAEFKLGFIAQSCLAPGFSSMMSNLFAMRSDLSSPEMKQWQNEYLQGTGCEMYTEILSPSFIGMTFAQAAEACFVKLKLLIIAIEEVNGGGGGGISINPRGTRIRANTMGYVIAQDAEEVKRILHYCKACHENVRNLNMIVKCKCMSAAMEEEKRRRSLAQVGSPRPKVVGSNGMVVGPGAPNSNHQPPERPIHAKTELDQFDVSGRGFDGGRPGLSPSGGRTFSQIEGGRPTFSPNKPGRPFSPTDFSPTEEEEVQLSPLSGGRPPGYSPVMTRSYGNEMLGSEHSPLLPPCQQSTPGSHHHSPLLPPCQQSTPGSHHHTPLLPPCPPPTKHPKPPSLELTLNVHGSHHDPGYHDPVHYGPVHHGPLHDPMHYGPISESSQHGPVHDPSGGAGGHLGPGPLLAGQPTSLGPVVPARNTTNSFSDRAMARQLDLDFGFDRDLGQIKYEYDSTGTFHWTPTRSVEEVLVTRHQISRMVLNSHVVVLLFAEPDGPLIGLRNLIMPLRASNLKYHELKHVVVVGSARYIEREWDALKNLPKISVLHGSPLSRADLRAVNVNLSDMCVILSAKISTHEDPSMVDKEAILASLNTNAMSFNKYDNVAVDFGSGGLPQRKGEVYGARVRMVLTEVVNDSNIQYLNPDDDDEPGTQLYVTQAFATGTALAVSVLDSIMSTAYYNHQALTMIKSLISGGMTPELEIILAEGAGIQPGITTQKVTFKNGSQSQCSIFSIFRNI